MKYMIGGGDGYWFAGFEDGEPIFDAAKGRGQHFADVTAATIMRDALAQMCGDDSLAVHTETIR